jgi:cysteinyl-tRNA synthetase
VGGAGGDDAAITAAIAARRSQEGAQFRRIRPIRAELLAQGIILEDKPDGTTNWRRA